MLNKVPEVTLYFWVIKILATTVGETAADYLDSNLGLGLTGDDARHGRRPRGALVWQFRAQRYVPCVYWLAVVLISVVGTLITDNLVDNFGVPLATTTIVFAVALAVDVRGLVRSERTLSIHTIVTTPARGVLLAGRALHLRARHGRRRPGRGAPERRVLGVGAALRRR